jgi:AraC family transcriptional regulator of adaptative response/methylated-DNA-[protein]-cysteine methyltransferase
MRTEEQWQVVAERDRSFDGSLFYGVASTGVYCRPSCPSKRPKPENVRFFDSAAEAESAGFRECQRCRPKEVAAAAELVRRVTAVMDAHPDEPLTLQQLSAKAGVSAFHLQRTFKKATGVSPKAYMSERRLKRFGRTLAEAGTVTDAIYESGFGASSRAYEQSAGALGMRPGERKKRAAGVAIRYTIAPTEFGLLLAATTDVGVCAVRLGDSAEQLEADFRRDFGRAELTRDDDELLTLIDQILVLIGGAMPHPQIPVDVQATAFQRRVWEYLRQIPRGETRSYSQVAADIGAPSSTRAVASACARNEVALIVPCHRVIGANGKLTGFRWGVERKRQLLKKEQS